MRVGRNVVMNKNDNVVGITTNDDELVLVIKSGLQNEQWGSYWGEYQQEFESGMYTRIVIDLTHCYNADIFPLLSLTLNLLEASISGKKIKILLRKIKNGDNKSYNYRVLLKFLASQNLLKIWCQNFTVFEGREVLVQSRINQIAKFNVKAMYSGRVIYPFTFFDCGRQAKEAIISEIMSKSLSAIKDGVSYDTYKRISEQLYHVTTELVENIERHAYDNNDKAKTFGIYIRERSGLLSDSDVSHDINYENYNCPALSTLIFRNCYSFVEIFITDSGKGLSKSLSDAFKAQNDPQKFPIRSLYYKVFKDGLRRDTENSLTAFGGLHFLCRLLKETNGFIWCNEGNEWVGASSAGILDGTIEDINARVIERQGNYIPKKGLNWGIRIPLEAKIANEGNECIYRWKGASNPIKEVFYQDHLQDNYLGHLIYIDERMEKKIRINGMWENWEEQAYVKKASETGDDNDTFLWFPKENNSKNNITRKINKFFKNAKNIEKISLIIGDISPINVLSYYYALNESKIVKLSKIILITTNWDLVIFENICGIITQNKDEEERYYTAKGISVVDSLASYANVRRQIDSYLYWEQVFKNNRERLFINANVFWSNETQLNGYLDIERANQNERALYIVENALLRLRGFSLNGCVKYENIDETVLMLCNDLNSKLGTVEERAMVIKVCGAAVTGYTQAAKFVNENSEKVVLFVRNNELELKNTMIMLLWPTDYEKWGIEKDSSTYYRIGKTSLISKNNEVKKVLLKNNYSSIVTSKKDMYSSFQNEYPQFVKYGHYKTDSHHYLIGFDLIKYMKYSYMKKEGAFPFFLWKIIQYLSKNDLNENIEAVKDEEWKKILKTGNYRRDSIYGELVLYHYNSFTEYVMQKIVKILPNKLAEKVIPISFYKIQPKGSSLILSPLIVDRIKSALGRGGSNVLFIDSSYATGRKMLEIKNVLRANEIGKVAFFSMLDLRRLRQDDPSNMSYWKIDVPRLDNDGGCVLCNTISRIKRFQTKLNAEYEDRILKWIDNWECTNISDYKAFHGIERTIISNYEVGLIQGDEKTISMSVKDSDTLNLVTAESLCDLYRDDFVYQLYTSHKTDLQYNQRIQLICTQILLFGNQNSRQLQLSLLSDLIKFVAKTDKCNSYTSLAGIVLFTQNTEVIYEMLKEILESNKPYFKNLRKILLGATNPDLIIALGYFMKNNNEIERLLNSYQEEPGKKYEFIEKLNEIVIPNGKLTTDLREFQGMLVNEMGSRHNTNLQKLIDEKQIDENRFFNIENDLKRMNQLAKSFPVSNMNSKKSTKIDFGIIDSNIILLENAFTSEMAEKRRKGTKEISEDTLNLLKECQSVFYDVLDRYFIEYNNSKDYLMSLVANAEKNNGKRIKVNITQAESLGKDFHKYYYWTQGIEKEFGYLLDNVHSCDCFLDEEKEYLMQVDIVFEYNDILITCSSWSLKSAFSIRENFKKKNRLSKQQAIALEVEFDFETTKESYGDYSMLKAKMRVPAVYKKIKSLGEG